MVASAGTRRFESGLKDCCSTTCNCSTSMVILRKAMRYGMIRVWDVSLRFKKSSRNSSSSQIRNSVGMVDSAMCFVITRIIDDGEK